ncbi:MFS transporter [uncultured Methanospirillum sp.]|uniref:MFS transporter n=1 Tax=uncultured Methanospirillum sp. TaxID=262503 RepID=UPI0029C7860A|nr:MFS transporter [uncultured Methanospirillum sp.]
MTPLLNSSTELTPVHYRVLGMCWAGWIFDFYDLLLLTNLFVWIGKDLNISSVQFSYALGVSLAASAAGGIIFGLLADRYGRKPVLQLSIIIYSLGALLCGFATSLESLILFRIITGLGVGGEWATGQTYIAELFPAQIRGKYASYVQTGAPIGILLASVMGGFIAPIIGWRACFIVSVLPTLFVFFIRRNIPESDLWERTAERRNLTNPEIHPESLPGVPDRKYWKLFLFALIVATLGMSAYWFTYSWLPEYLYMERSFSLSMSAIWIIVCQIGGIAGYLSFGIVADRIGRRVSFTLYTTIMAIGLVMITLLWDLIAGIPGVILGCMALVGFGTGFFGGYGPLFAEIFPTAIRNTLSGAAFNIARGVQLLTPVLIAYIGEMYNLGVGICLGALFAVATGLWIWVFPETKGRALEP